MSPRRFFWPPGLAGFAFAALGAGTTLALVHTWAWALVLVSLAALAGPPLSGQTDDMATRGFGLGWCFGAGAMGATFWWLFISLHQYGGLPAALAVLAVAALAGALALFYATAIGVFHRLVSIQHLARNEWTLSGGKQATWWAAALPCGVFASLWTLADITRGRLFTGLPWGATGYAFVDSPLASLAPWVGVYGMGWTAAFAAAALALLAVTRGRRWGPALGSTVAGMVLAVLGPTPFTQAAGQLSATLLQLNVPQDEKFAAQHMPAILERTATALTASHTQLVVAPETAVPLLPFMLDNMAPGYRERLKAHFGQPGQGWALVGMPLGGGSTGFSNSVVGLGPDAAPYRYDKHHLVPFGEIVPLGFRWFVDLLNIPLGDFDRGALGQAPFTVAGLRVAPNICYEDLFGEELAAQFVNDKVAPHVLVNVSNIAWFGHTVAVPQHLNISRVRSLEFQRPMLRATNTGATAFIDHAGRVQSQMTPFTQGQLVGQVQGREGLTLYARWTSAFGLWPLIGFCMLWVLAAVWTRWRQA